MDHQGSVGSRVRRENRAGNSVNYGSEDEGADDQLGAA
jgi:hypothetical protein